MVKEKDIKNFTNQLRDNDVEKIFFVSDNLFRLFGYDRHFRIENMRIHICGFSSYVRIFTFEGGGRRYRCCIVFHISELRNRCLQDIVKFFEKENLDKLVIFSNRQHEYRDILDNFKQDIRVVALDKKSNIYSEIMQGFVIIKENEQKYNILVNCVANYLVKEMKKIFHLILSDIAAENYDDHYGKTRIATKEVMKKEEEIVKNIVEGIIIRRNEGDNIIAVDVGCGTGRHSIDLKLHEKFSKIYAFDFSRAMIDQAIKKKKNLNIKNIDFFVADIEDEHKAFKSFEGRVDFILASFGMGSFVEDLSRMIRKFYMWLKKDGELFISFYNRSSILDIARPNWRDSSLSADLDSFSNTLTVNLSNDLKFYIYCRPYDDYAENLITKLFNIEKKVSYPTIMSLLPNRMMEKSEALNLFKFVDDILSEEPEHFYGYYVFLHAVKKEEIGYAHEKILSELEEYGIKYDMVETAPLYSIEDTYKYLKAIGKKYEGLLMEQLLKTVIYECGKNYFVIITPGDKSINTGELYRAIQALKLPNINISRDKFQMASKEDIAMLGFMLGGLSPFGFSEYKNVYVFVDKAIENIKGDHVYVGAGKNNCGIKIEKNDLMRVFKDNPKFNTLEI